MTFEYQPIIASQPVKGEVLSPAPEQAVARGYSPGDMERLMGRLRESAPEVQTGILERVKQQHINDPQQIAGMIDAHFQQADARAAAQPMTIEQAAQSVAHMPKLAVADMGATTAALAHGAGQSVVATAARAPEQGGGRTA